jgi:hypothetical protein
LYIPICMFLGSRQEDKSFRLIGSKH